MILDHGPILFINVDVCSVEIFTPLYTSRVIQGIAIDKSEATFVNAIIWMSILSAARYDRLIFLYCNEPFDVTARRRPTYSVKLRLWKISTFYFKIVAIPTPLSAHYWSPHFDDVVTEYALKSVAVQQFQNYVKATACLRRRSTVTG